MKHLLRLMVSEDDLTPLLLGFIAVNGDLRLYTSYLYTLCKSGSGGSRRIACRYIEYLATVKEPVIALDRLAEELGSTGNVLREITRALRLGLEPGELAERIIDRLTTRIRARVELVDEIAKASLETLALLATILTFSLLLGGVFLGSTSVAILGVVIVALVSLLASLLIPSGVALGAPRVPKLVYVASIVSLIASALAVYTARVEAALVSVVAVVPVALFTRRWWKQMRSVSRVALQLAESLQLGRIALLEPSGDGLLYNILTGSAKGLYSNLGVLLVDLMRLLPQEGSVTAARLLRSFVEFASRYLETVKTILVRSIVYEAIVATLMPVLAFITLRVAGLLATSFGAVGGAQLVTLSSIDELRSTVRMMLLPAIAYTLATSRIGRGTPLLPLLHPLVALAATLLLG